MIRCYLTGAELPLDKALVLNRRLAVDLLAETKARAERIERLLAQLGPLDTVADQQIKSAKTKHKVARRRHRLVSAAASEVLSAGIGRGDLFVTWAAYKTRVRYFALCARRQRLELAGVLDGCDTAQMVQLDKLGAAVLCNLDAAGKLPRDTRLAIAVGVCAASLDKAPEVIAGELRAAAVEGAPIKFAALIEGDLRALRAHLGTMAKPA